MEFRAEVKRLHQQLSDAVANLHQSAPICTWQDPLIDQAVRSELKQQMCLAVVRISIKPTAAQGSSKQECSKEISS
ncbi:hypothetical protein QJQ45_017559 [Haematococcus lacustris]|nr:hypothetical protein QJQ45_017559 [Haematococcus lacustris]